jgi:hypothetical protein
MENVSFKYHSNDDLLGGKMNILKETKILSLR